MARSVPNRFVLPLTLLAGFPEVSFKELSEELSHGCFLGSPRALRLLVEKANPELGPGDGREVSLYLQAMANIAVSPNHRPIDDVISEMVLADNLELTPDERELAKSRVLSLVETDAIRTLAFIVESHSRHEKPLSETSIAVDMRPAFDGDNRLLAMTPWQTLLVSYDDGGSDSKTMEFALDRDDLLALKAQAENALSQLDGIEQSLREAGVRLWSPNVNPKSSES